MRKWTPLAILSTLVASLVFVGAVRVSAHHSFTSFWYMDKTSTIEGVVVELKIVNPHPTMKVEVTDASGQKVVWLITATGTASALVKGGWTPQALVAGTRVKVEGHPPRREGAKALAAGDITRLTDGTIWSFGGSRGIPVG